MADAICIFTVVTDHDGAVIEAPRGNLNGTPKVSYLEVLRQDDTQPAEYCSTLSDLGPVPA